jgi:hypothetical protein
MYLICGSNSAQNHGPFLPRISQTKKNNVTNKNEDLEMTE